MREIVHLIQASPLLLQMHDLAFWNIRGLNTQIKQLEVRKLIADNDISLLVLNETRVKKLNQVMVLNGFTKWKYLDNYYHAQNGRIWVLWDDKVFQVDEQLQGNQFIHAKVTRLEYGDSFWLTAVYAFNSEAERKVLWYSIISLSQSIKEPWILMGDFNTFLKQSERVRNGMEVGGHTNELMELFSATGLGYLHFSGIHLTWCNNQEGESRTYTKLDRILINSEWFAKYHESYAVFLPPGISDHSPGVARLGSSLQYKRYPFRFCNIWASDDKFHAIVNSIWATNVQGCHMYKLVQKLKLLRAPLKELHRARYTKLSEQVLHARDRMLESQRILSDDPTNPLLIDRVNRWKIDYTRAAANELRLLQQKAKVQWLQDMDKSTK